MFGRGRVLILGACLALAFFAGTWVSSTLTPAPTWTPFPTAEPLIVTTTSSAAEVSATAQVLDTVAQFPTQDLSLVTNNTDAGATAIARGVDPIYVTATYIVGRATQTEAYYLTATGDVHELMLTETAENPGLPFPTPSVDQLDGTATMESYKVTSEAVATQNALATLAPTLDMKEVDDLQAQWRTDLEQAAGFSDPIFDYIAYDLLFPDWPIGKYSQADLHSHLEIEVESVTYNGDKYVAVLVRRLHTVFLPQFWMFRLHGDTHNVVVMRNQIDSLGTIYFDSPDGQTVGFADGNGNGLPDIALTTNGGGSCGTPNIVLFEIQPDGEVVNVTSALGRASIMKWVDLEQDGKWEIEVIDRGLKAPIQSPDGCPFSGETHYYGWDGTAYTDVSATLDDSYWPEIGVFWAEVEKQSGCIVPTYEMYQVLVDYEIRGKLSETWTKLAPLLRWDQCSPKQLIDSAKDMGNLLSWIGSHMSREQRENQSATPS